MEYLKIEPADHLKPYVHWFGLLRSQQSEALTHTFRIVSDGCPGLIFQQTADSFYTIDGKPFPHLYLHGPATTHSQNTASGTYGMIFVHFQPQALKAIFGIDAHELTDGYTALDSVLKNDLCDRLLTSEDTYERIALLSDFLTQQLIRNRPKADNRVAFFIRQTANHNCSLKEIQSQLNLSERSLERLIKTNIGLSPKRFMRINRFQAALRLLDTQPTQLLTHIAYENDYFDQSHYIRDFREFAGATPKEFLARANGPLVNFPEWT
ncbi:AraC family transcriptional regulator [Spirosoma litoris]